MSHDKIADALGIPNEIIPFEEEKRVDIVKADTGRDAVDDYILNRSTIRSLVQVSSNSLTELLTVARSSQKARDYEVAAKMVDTIASLTKTLKDLHKKDIDTDQTPKVQADSVTVDKAIFVGTTKELMEKIKEIRVTNKNE